MVAIVEITKKCNLNCKHCFIEAKSEDISLSALENGLQSLKKHFDDFRFVGGEPFVVPERLDFAVKTVKEWGKKVNITTNGLLVKENVEKIRSWNLQDICISVDGIENSHDTQRNHKGAFEKVKEAAFILAGLGINIQVSFCLTKLNYCDIEKVYRLCEEFKAEFLRIQPMVPLMGKNQDLILPPELLKKTLEDCKRIKGYTEILVPEHLCLLPGAVHCVAGELLIYICNDGAVMPCIFAPLAIGKIGVDTAEVLIDRALFKNPASGCKDCAEYLKCRGGCRGGSLMYYNDLNAPDPNCRIAESEGYADIYLKSLENFHDDQNQ